MFGITSYVTSVCTWKNLSGIKFLLVFIFIFLVICLLMVVFIGVCHVFGSKFVILEMFPFSLV